MSECVCVRERDNLLQAVAVTSIGTTKHHCYVACMLPFQVDACLY